MHGVGDLVGRTCAMIKPGAVQHTGKILECMTSNGFLVKHMRMCHLSLKDAKEFYKVHEGKPFFT
jgi:nucleoside-diphosphate kinase